MKSTEIRKIANKFVKSAWVSPLQINWNNKGSGILDVHVVAENNKTLLKGMLDADDMTKYNSYVDAFIKDLKKIINYK